MNETDQDDQLKQSLTSFLKLYKHFFEPRLLSLLEENTGSFGNDTNSAKTDGPSEMDDLTKSKTFIVIFWL